MTEHSASIDENDLKATFSALTSPSEEEYSPFRWQMRMLRMLLSGDVPSGIDRRTVVDQASRFAEQLRENLPPELAVKLGLKGCVERLPVSTLRGELTGNRDWPEDAAGILTTSVAFGSSP